MVAQLIGFWLLILSCTRHIVLFFYLQLVNSHLHLVHRHRVVPCNPPLCSLRLQYYPSSSLPSAPVYHPRDLLRHSRSSPDIRTLNRYPRYTKPAHFAHRLHASQIVHAFSNLACFVCHSSTLAARGVHTLSSRKKRSPHDSVAKLYVNVRDLICSHIGDIAQAI